MTDPLVIFTPSGKRGHFPKGTPILTAARQLGAEFFDHRGHTLHGID